MTKGYFQLRLRVPKIGWAQTQGEPDYPAVGGRVPPCASSRFPVDAGCPPGGGRCQSAYQAGRLYASAECRGATMAYTVIWYGRQGIVDKMTFDVEKVAKDYAISMSRPERATMGLCPLKFARTTALSYSAKRRIRKARVSRGLARAALRGGPCPAPAGRVFACCKPRKHKPFENAKGKSPLPGRVGCWGGSGLRC